jgi:hypothetical protein
MAITQIKGSNIEDGTVVAADIKDDAVTNDKILDDEITNVKIKTNAAIVTTKISGALTSVASHGLGTAAALTAGTAAGNVIVLDGSGNIPSGALGNVPPSDTSVLEYNIAMLAFKHASQSQITKFAMVDQMIDEYQDTTGIDDGPSSNHNAAGSTTAKYYGGGSVSTPTVTITGTGNTTTIDGDYSVHSFIANGTLVSNLAIAADYLVVAGGGGGGGGNYSGGAGGGGLRTSFGSTSGGGVAAEADANLQASATYTIVVGAGGTAGAAGPTGNGGNGQPSSIAGTGVAVTTVGGGGGGGALSGSAGGSGGGAGREGGSGQAAGGAPTAGEGFIGGTSNPGHSGAGGGGASAPGINTSTVATNVGTKGGDGLAVAIRGDHVTIPSVVGDWYGSTGNATYATGTLTYTQTSKCLYGLNVLTGDFTLEATPTNVAGGSWIGVFASAEEETWHDGSEFGNMHVMTSSYFYGSLTRSSQTAGFNKGGNTSLAAYSSSNGQVVKIQRVGSTITNYLDGVLKHTETGVTTGDMHVVLGGGGIGGCVYTDISWTEPAEIFAGGGGGASWGSATWSNSGAGGKGGGAAAVPGTGRNLTGSPNTGGGGAGVSAAVVGGVGGTGIVVIRNKTTTTVTADLILQSVAATNAPIGTAPTTGDLVVLIDDGGSGTSAVQTNIKGYISVNGSFSSLDTGSGGDHKQATFTDEGAWGTAKQRILVSRNVDISNLTTGSAPFQMKYKLTTHSQSAGTMETHIHATSLAWA